MGRNLVLTLAMVGVLGVHGLSQSAAPANVPLSIRKLIPKTAADQWWLRSGNDYFVVYHTSRAAMNFNPHIVWISKGKMQATEILDPDAEFAGAREFRLNADHKGIAVAFHFASDRSGTWYRVYSVDGGELKLLRDFQVVEGQLVIDEAPSGARLRIWQEAGACHTGESFCVWCLHRYRIDEYRWAGGSAGRSSSIRASSSPQIGDDATFYLLSRSLEANCQDPKLFHREPIAGVPAPPSVSKGIEGEP